MLAPYAELSRERRARSRSGRPRASTRSWPSGVGGRNPAEAEARKLKRFYFNFSADVELDNAYRVMIPTHLMEYAGLDKEVTVTGSGECLEVWDRAPHTDEHRRASDPRSPTSPHLLATLLDMTNDARPGSGRRADRPRSTRSRARSCVDCTVGGGGHARLLADRHRSGRDADRDRPRPDRGGALRRAGRRGRVRDPLHPRRLRRRPGRAAGRAPAGRHRLHGPRDVVDAGRHLGARLLVLLRRAAGHADGSRPGPDRVGDRQHLGRAAPGPRRCASTARSATPPRSLARSSAPGARRS